MKREQKLNIVIFVSYTYPFIGSGIGNVALTQARYLARSNNQVTLVSSNIPKTENDFTKYNVRFLKLKSFNFLYRFHIPVPLNLFNLKVIAAIKNSDIVHIHDILYPSSFMAVVFAKVYKKPVILTQHIPFIQYEHLVKNVLQKIGFYLIGRYILESSSKILYLNSEVRDWLKGYENKLVYLPNGVDTKYFHPVSVAVKKKLRKKYSLPLDKKIVLFVGRLVPKKGYDLVYKAADQNSYTVLVGSGIVPENIINPHLKFLGEKTPAELKEIYQLSDIFVLPSHSEGFPLSVQEAMASGLAIIVSDLQCYKDLNFNRKLVELIKPSVVMLKKVINRSIRNKKRIAQMKKYSTKAARQLYSWHQNTENLRQIYVYEKNK